MELPTMPGRPGFATAICRETDVLRNFRNPASLFRKSAIYQPPSRPPEGRLAIVTDAGRDAMDADALLTNGADADGEVVWSWHPDAGVKSVDAIPPMTVARKPGHRGDCEGNR
jgi:hypothetical protein